MKQSGTITSQKYTFTYSAISDTGLVRTHNEDLFLILEDEKIFCVADGAGGQGKGDMASYLTIKGIKEVIEGTNNKFFDDTVPIGEATIAVPAFIGSSSESVSESGTILIPAIHHANELCRNAEVPNMASTIVCCHFENEHLHIAHVGDSRAYCFNKDRLSILTKDHSLVNFLYDKGEITEEEKRTHPRRNVILRAVGAEENIKITQSCIDIIPGAMFMLCSDGLTSMLTDNQICSLIRKCDNINQLSSSLVQTAKDNGGRDNITIIIIKVEHV